MSDLHIIRMCPAGVSEEQVHQFEYVRADEARRLAERIRELEGQLAATNEAYRMRDLEAREVSSFFKAECAEYRSKISSLEAKINGAQLCGEHVNAILSDEELPVHRGCVVCALVLQAESDEQRLEKAEKRYSWIRAKCVDGFSITANNDVMRAIFGAMSDAEFDAAIDKALS